jgi:hypothetical protein
MIPTLPGVATLIFLLTWLLLGDGATYNKNVTISCRSTDDDLARRLFPQQISIVLPSSLGVEFLEHLGASETGLIAERAGQKVRRIGSGFGYEGERPALTGARCASVHGFIRREFSVCQMMRDCHIFVNRAAVVMFS